MRLLMTGKEDDDNGRGQQKTARTMTAMTMGMTARTTTMMVATATAVAAAFLPAVAKVKKGWLLFFAVHWLFGTYIP